MLCADFLVPPPGPWSRHPAVHTKIWKYINDIYCSLATVIFIKNISVLCNYTCSSPQDNKILHQVSE